MPSRGTGRGRTPREGGVEKVAKWVGIGAGLATVGTLVYQGVRALADRKEGAAVDPGEAIDGVVRVLNETFKDRGTWVDLALNALEAVVPASWRPFVAFVHAVEQLAVSNVNLRGHAKRAEALRRWHGRK